VRPTDVQRKLREWGYGEVVAGHGFTPSRAHPSEPERPFHEGEQRASSLSAPSNEEPTPEPAPGEDEPAPLPGEPGQ
jgi:hypothetical protein